MLPAAAANDDISFAPYTGIAGSFMYLSSINSSIYKIPLANPSSYIDLASTTYRGRIAIHDNRIHLWGRKTAATGLTDETAHYISHIDHATIAGFTAVTNETFGTGDGSTINFSHQLAGAGGIKTIFGVTAVSTYSAINILNITQSLNAQITANGHGFAPKDIVAFAGLSTNLLTGTGTMISTGGQTVTGSGTAFTTQLKQGSKILLPSGSYQSVMDYDAEGNPIYETNVYGGIFVISAIGSDTSLTLTQIWAYRRAATAGHSSIML